MIKKKITKKNYIILTFFLSVVIVSLLSTNVNSSLFSWVAGKITDNITDEIFEGINQSLGEGIGAIIEWIANIFTNPLGPSLTTFVTYTQIGDINARDLLYGYGVSAGMFIITLLFGFYIIVYFFNGKITDIRDTPLSLLVNYSIGMIMCYKGDVIIDTVIDIFDDIYNVYTKNAIKKSVGTINFLNLVSGTESKSDGKVSLNLLGANIVFKSFPGVSLVVLILQLFLVWKLIKGFLKLYLEMVKRYIISCSLLCTLPVFGSTVVSNNTNQIFKSYVRTIASSFLLLIFNIFWFKMCFFIATTRGGVIDNLIEYVFLLELLEIGTKADGILRSMGLGIATCGSALASSIGCAGRNIANTMRGANQMRQGSGALLQATGIMTGNKQVYNAGSIIGARPSDILNGNVGGTSFAEKAGSLGKTVSDSTVSGAQAANIVNDVMNNPTNRRFQNAANGLSEGKMAEAAQNIVGNNADIKVESANLQNYIGDDGQRHTGIKVQGTTSEGKQISGIIGKKESFTAGENLGNGNVMQTQNMLGNGETCDIKDVHLRAGSKAAKAVSDAEKNGYVFPEGSKVEKDGRTGNRMDAFNVIGNTGDIIGTIENDQFTMAANQLSNNQKDTAFATMQSEIMGGVQNEKGEWGSKDKNGNFQAGGTRYDSITDFKEVKGETGVYKATATDAEGNKRDFVATDKGTYVASRMNNNPESFMYSGNVSNASFAFDVNAGKLYKVDEKGNSSSDHKFGRNDKSEKKTDPYNAYMEPDKKRMNQPNRW